MENDVTQEEKRKASLPGASSDGKQPKLRSGWALGIGCKTESLSVIIFSFSFSVFLAWGQTKNILV